jgi:hypothetical protein
MTAEIRAQQALKALREAMTALTKSCASYELITQFAEVIAQAEIELDLCDE